MNGSTKKSTDAAEVAAEMLCSTFTTVSLPLSSSLLYQRDVVLLATFLPEPSESAERKERVRDLGRRNPA